jgi:hypothetical protein
VPSAHDVPGWDGAAAESGGCRAHERLLIVSWTLGPKRNEELGGQALCLPTAVSRMAVAEP